jgi:hypothetical protein
VTSPAHHPNAYNIPIASFHLSMTYHVGIFVGVVENCGKFERVIAPVSIAYDL